MDDIDVTGKPVGSKTKWFDDWEITRWNDGESMTKVHIALPHSFGNAKQVKFKRVSDARVIWLIGVLECALTQLSTIQNVNSNVNKNS